MIQNQKQTAILLFAYSSEKEANRKVFDKSEQLFEQLNQKTLVKAQKTGIHVFVITEKEQIGVTFGERFANAIQEAFNKGYSQVITIGNDSPNLKTHHLLKTLDYLQKGNAVLGPSFDGGTYLIALKKEHFSKEVFKSITWNTCKVFSELKKHLTQQNINVEQLGYLADIDSKEDLLFFINQFSKSFSLLKRFLISRRIKVYSYYKSFYTSKNYSYNNYNKGSPYAL